MKDVTFTNHKNVQVTTSVDHLPRIGEHVTLLSFKFNVLDVIHAPMEHTVEVLLGDGIKQK